MSYLRSVPTHLRIYRGIVESLGTYERLEMAIRTSLHEQELDYRARFPMYIGASLVSKCDFRTMQRNHRELRMTPLDRLTDDLELNTPRTKSEPYNVMLHEAEVRGNRHDGYTLGATFNSEIFDIEKHAIYRALGTAANAYVPAAEDYWIKLSRLATPFPDTTVDALQEMLPRSLTLEPIQTAIFSDNIIR